MVIIVNDDRQATIYAEDIFQAAITGVATLLVTADELTKEALHLWMSGRIRKIVKRGRNKAWDDAVSIGQGMIEVAFGTAQVRVLPPFKISEMPAGIKKLQVTGLNAELKPELDDADSDRNWSGLEITVDSRLGMSTGKIVAQICHIAQLFLMNAEEDKVNSWMTMDAFPVKILFSEDIESLPFDVEVHDAGFTEIPAGSKTAVGIYVNP